MKLVNQQLIKNNNLKTLYRYIHQTPGVSRAQLAELSGLSKTTVSSLVDELIERKFVQDTGILDDATSVGRKPNSLHLLQGQHYVAVISWRSKDICCKLVDICGTIIKESDAPLHEPDSYVTLSKELLENLLAPDFPREKLLGVAIVVPAMIDPKRKEIFATTLYLSPNGNIDLIKNLKKAFAGYPLAILNDTACAAYAEKVYTKIPQEDFAYINFQYGIGAALFIRDELLGEATASYTQFGHYSIDPCGELCSCDNRGCLELKIGEHSLKKRLHNAGCRSSLIQSDKITYADLSSAALYGDLSAQTLLKDIARDFSQALSNLVCIVHPKLIIIGGRGRDLGPLFLNEVLHNLKETGFRQMLDSIQIRYSFLDSTAYFVGGMKYLFDQHYDFTQDSSAFFYIG